MTTRADLAHRLLELAALAHVGGPADNRHFFWDQLEADLREAARALVGEGGPDDDRAYDKLSASRDAYMKELHAAGLLPTEQIIKVSTAFARGFDAGYDAHPAPAGLEQARNAALEEAAQVAINHPSNIVRGHHIIADAIRALAAPAPTVHMSRCVKCGEVLTNDRHAGQCTAWRNCEYPECKLNAACGWPADCSAKWRAAPAPKADE